MGDGTRENPYTREDVRRLIKEHGDKGDGLNLSEKYFEAGIDLRGFDLKGIILHLAHLEEANLEFAHLEEAILGHAHLERADLFNAQLEGAYLWGAEFSPETSLQGADWGNFILKEERSLRFGMAANTYRRLKIWHTNAGIYNIAGKFFYREMEAKRKAQNWKKKPHLKLWDWVMRLLCGYGEKPERVVVSALVIIFGLAIAYRFGGLSLPYSIYYSFVSFTALGYGSWVPVPTDWVKGLGVAEAVIGVFMMALFLVTFTKKTTR